MPRPVLAVARRQFIARELWLQILGVLVLFNAVSLLNFVDAIRTSWIFFALLIFSEWIVFVIVLSLMSGRERKQWLGQPRIRDVLAGVVVFAAWLALWTSGVLIWFLKLFPNINFGFTYYLSDTAVFGLLQVARALTAGIVEEVVFRCFIVRRIRQSVRLQVGKAAGLRLAAHALLALTLSAIFFGLSHWHLGIGGMALAALFGLVLGTAAMLGNSVHIAIVAHCLYNLLIITGGYRWLSF